MWLGLQVSLHHNARPLAESTIDLGIMDLGLEWRRYSACSRRRGPGPHALCRVGCFVDEFEILGFWSPGDTCHVVPVRDIEVLCRLMV